MKTTNTKAVILIENGADDYLVGNESKERFFVGMIQAGVEWNFHDHSGTPHGFSLPTTLGHPRHLHERSDRRSTMKILTLFTDIFSQFKQNQVNGVSDGALIPG